MENTNQNSLAEVTKSNPHSTNEALSYEDLKGILQGIGYIEITKTHTHATFRHPESDELITISQKELSPRGNIDLVLRALEIFSRFTVFLE